MGIEELIQMIMRLYRSNKSVEQSIKLQLEEEGTAEFLTCLDAWKLLEVKKVAVRITEVENTIKNRTKLS